MADLHETLCVTDNSFERARKAWKMMGFVNDKLGQTGTLAEIFMAYRDLDKDEANHEADD